jgi:hypothetical protein
MLCLTDFTTLLSPLFNYHNYFILTILHYTQYFIFTITSLSKLLHFHYYFFFTFTLLSLLFHFHRYVVIIVTLTSQLLHFQHYSIITHYFIYTITSFSQFISLSLLLHFRDCKFAERFVNLPVGTRAK